MFFVARLCANSVYYLTLRKLYAIIKTVKRDR
nr:MAG TPA: hypothetical protein [Caudoviricetes sp.]